MARRSGQSSLPPPLEMACLGTLWTLGEGTVREVVTALAPRKAFAYTTVMTILTRLWKKGQVTRSRSGRAYAYAPTLSQAEFLAERMGGELRRTRDRSAVLSQFVDKLSKADTKALRVLLLELDD